MADVELVSLEDAEAPDVADDETAGIEDVTNALVENIHLNEVLRRVLLGPPVLVLPHPSGLSRAWNDPTMYERSRAFLAEALALPPKAVGVYRARVMEKMKLSTQAELAHYARSHALGSIEFAELLRQAAKRPKLPAARDAQ